MPGALNKKIDRTDVCERPCNIPTHFYSRLPERQNISLPISIAIRNSNQYNGVSMVKAGSQHPGWY